MRLVALLSILFLVGCPDREISEVTPVSTLVEVNDRPFFIDRNVDILFVIDNSESMVDEQTSLTTNFDRFIGVLDNIEGGLPDLHIGVVTTNMGAGGLPIPNCAGAGDGGVLHTGGFTFDLGARYIEDFAGTTPGTRVGNHGTTPLVDVFRQIATVGAQGCPFEQHLKSMRTALENNPSNAGFLRDSAHLAVVFISDEDDCSSHNPQLYGAETPELGPLDSFRCFEFGITCDEPDPRAPGLRTNCRSNETSPYISPVAGYVDFLRTLKPDTREVIVAGIVGDRDPVAVGTRDVGGEIRSTLDPSCTYLGNQSADPAIRLGTFLDGFPGDNTMATICDDDLSSAIEAVGELIIDSIGTKCFQRPLADVNPDTPEPDYECSVVLEYPGADQLDQVIPQCDATASRQPCWQLAPEPECADSPTPLGLDVVYATTPPEGTRVNGSCVVE